MKITKEKLNQIIKEEIEAVIDEGFLSKLFNRPDKRWAAELENIESAIYKARNGVIKGYRDPRTALEDIEKIEAKMSALLELGGEPTDAQIEERDELGRELKAFKRRQIANLESDRDDFERAERKAAAKRAAEREAAAERRAQARRGSINHECYDRCRERHADDLRRGYTGDYDICKQSC